jgi:hypothetical protein
LDFKSTNAAAADSYTFLTIPEDLHHGACATSRIAF